MSGILDYNKLTSQGLISTVNIRNGLLSRNLPPPVNETLTLAGLASKLQDIGNVINVPILGTNGENIPIYYDENKKMIPLSILYRNTKNVNLNRYAPQNDVYETYGVVVPPNLGYLTPVGFGDKDKGPYPTQYIQENFSLINNGSDVGVIYPYNVIQQYKTLNHNNESSLGLIGGKELEKSIQSKVSRVQEQSNPNGLYYLGNITPSLSTDGGVNNYINSMKGSQIIFNFLPNGSVGWNEYTSSSDTTEGVEPTLGLEQRVNTLLTRTNLNQVKFLFELLNHNGYRPNYTDSRFPGTSDSGINSRYYIGTEKNTNRGSLITKKFLNEDFNGNDIGTSTSKRTDIDNKFLWATGGENNFNEKTLLYKTQQLVNNNGNDVFINQTKKYFKDKDSGKIISRGNSISSLELIDAAQNGNFCRVWTVNDNYNYLNAIRNRGLFSSPDKSLKGFSVTNEKASLSVLMENGIPKYHPVANDSKTTLKKYMLSLENLAWTDNLSDLPLNEIGPGDILSGNKGRVMWFAPYDLSFDDSSTANWTKTEFIGRGEPVYTYNNASRSGTLSFTILVDHPKVINGYRGERNNLIERFFAGCVTPTQFLEQIKKSDSLNQHTIDEVDKKLNEIKNQKSSNTQKVKETVSFYFTDGKSEGYTGDFKKLINLAGQILIDDGKIKITSEGFSKKDEKIGDVGATTNALKDLSKSRAEQVLSDYLSKLPNIKKDKYSKVVKGYGTSLSDSTDKSMRVDLTVENDSKSSAKAKKEEGLGDLSYYPEFAQLIDDLIIDESSYFDYVDANYPNYFSTISSKIKYFQPGYHSTTPEGLNTRLTFLNQCLRQGPSIYDKNTTKDGVEKGIQPQNLSFGRPPVCILRIGDFFYTKVVINSLSIAYDGAGGLQWDLNPEGIGVQPMTAKVSLSVDLIGGHSLVGPINRLQNALSFNYYANTEMYDPRADSINKSTGQIVDGIKLGEKKKSAGVDLNKLTQSLKSEGIIDQKNDSKTGDNSSTNSKSEITISSDKSNVIVNTKNDTKVKIYISEKGNFKMVTNINQTEDSKTYEVDTSSFKDVDEKINKLKEENESLNSSITTKETSIISGTTTNINKELKELNKDKEKYKKNQEKITILEGESKNNKVKVEAVKTSDEGSLVSKEFTFIDSGLK